MKKNILFSLCFLMFSFVFAISDVNASCVTTSLSDCNIAEYKYNYLGSTSDKKLYVGVFNYEGKNNYRYQEIAIGTGLATNENGKKYITGSSSGMLYTSLGYDGKNIYPYIIINEKVNSLPIAVCLYPKKDNKTFNGSFVVDSVGSNGIVKKGNLWNYIYFNKDEIEKAIKDGYCKKDDLVFYDKYGVSLYNNNYSLETFCPSGSGTTRKIISKNVTSNEYNSLSYSASFSGGICHFTINNEKISYLNLDETKCNASNVKKRCSTYENGYQCDFYVCEAKKNIEKSIGKKCILKNEKDKNDILYAYNVDINSVTDETLKKNYSSVGYVWYYAKKFNEKTIKFCEEKKLTPENSSFDSCPTYVMVNKKDNRIISVNSENIKQEYIKNGYTTVYKMYNANDSYDIYSKDVDSNGYYTSDVSHLTLEMSCFSEPNASISENSGANVGYGNVYGLGPNNNKNNNNNNNNSEIVYNTCTISCGNVEGIPEKLPVFTRRLVDAIKFLIPIILVIMGMIDFLKAMTSNDEKVMSESPRSFVRRIIVSVLIFLVIVIIQFVVRLISDASIKSGNEKNPAESVAECVSCFISDKNACGEPECK